MPLFLLSFSLLFLTKKYFVSKKNAFIELQSIRLLAFMFETVAAYKKDSVLFNHIIQLLCLLFLAHKKGVGKYSVSGFFIHQRTH